MLVAAEELQRRVASSASGSRATTRAASLLLVGVLKGAVFFLSDLMRLIDIPVEVDFMAVASYGSATDSSGVVRILKDLDVAIEGRDVLIVEDIVDSGLTLQYLLRNLGSRNPRDARGLRAADQARAPQGRPADPLRRLRDPRPLRDRLRPRPRRALPQPPLRRRAGRPDQGYATVPSGVHCCAVPAESTSPWYAERLVDAYPSCRQTQPRSRMNRFFKSAAFPILIVIVLAFFVSKLISPGSSSGPPHTYPTLVTQDIPHGEVKSVARSRPRATRSTSRSKHGDQVRNRLRSPSSVPELGKAAATRRAIPYNIESAKSSVVLSLLTYLLPFVLFFGFWIFLMNQVQGGGSKVMSFGKSRAKRLSADSPKISFRDVAGVDEAVEELHEIKEFLENPKKFQALGARIPTGVLLYGPPGTGKTLLARAVAGEAGVPFFSISGSDFVEMFVGVGASRVRDLFEQAKQNSPCIIFMDEIDAVGRHRGAGLGGGHDEREQTLNQLLVEMDGFEAKDNIIMIAATNRPDILDPALLRPGRFDRQIAVDRPDRKGRAKILEVHTRGKPLAKEIDIDALAGQTPGFTGADLSNLINEAALLAARTGKREIGQVELEEGIMRVIAGPEKKTRVMSEKERLITAYHEMGHAIVGHYLEHADPVHKISVISRGQALGYTISMPQEDRFLTTRAELHDTMAMTLGGRAAEEIVFDEITTGASNDIEKVTATAKQMVMRFGMSEKLGPRVFGHDHGQPFLGREFSTEPDYSDEIAREIDDEVRRIIEVAHERARDILTEHRDSASRRSPRSSSSARRSRRRSSSGCSPARARRRSSGPTRATRPSCRCPPRRRARSRPRPLPRPLAKPPTSATAPSAGARRAVAPPAAFAAAAAPRRRPAELGAASSEPAGRRRVRSRRVSEASVMGVVNVTPDSFSDGGLFLDAAGRGRARARAGRRRAPRSSTSAASRRGPGAEPVAQEEELRGCCPSSRGSPPS